MARVQYSKNSPYSKTFQTSWYLDLYEHRPIFKSGNDQLVTIKAEHEYRPDLLSYSLYGTADFWWVFAVRNMDVITDPIWDFVPGLQIYAPSKTDLDRYLR